MSNKNCRNIDYSEVQLHNKVDDCWIIINDQVYDVTKQKNFHPVGQTPINYFAGKDATWVFNNIPWHNSEVKQILAGLKVGNLVRKQGETIPNNKFKTIIGFSLIMILFIYYFLFW